MIWLDKKVVDEAGGEVPDHHDGDVGLEESGGEPSFSTGDDLAALRHREVRTRVRSGHGTGDDRSFEPDRRRAELVFWASAWPTVSK